MTAVTPTIWYYFRPQDQNRFVVLLFAGLLAESLVLAWWIGCGRGAVKVTEYRMFGRVMSRVFERIGARRMKLTVTLGPLLIVACVSFLIWLDAPRPL